MKKKRKKSDLERLLEYAGEHKGLTYISWGLSAISSLMALVPFVFIWEILREVINAAPDFSQAEGTAFYGWMAVAFAVLSVVLYTVSLKLSYRSAVRISSNMKKTLLHHMAKLPLGTVAGFGSGRLRKIVQESCDVSENYLAHQMPDKANALATPFGLLFMMLFFDWRLGLISFIPMVLGIIILLCFMGKNLREIMKEYQDSLDNMSNEAVEYIRGIPVVKIFGQSVFSFRRFKESIDNYGEWAERYIAGLRLPMVLYTTIIYSIFAFLVAAAVWFSKGSVSGELILDLCFYIIITPAIALMMNRFMYQSKDAIFVHDALERIDSVLKESPAVISGNSEHPESSSVQIENLSFSYDGKKNVLRNISLSIGEKETAAFVGPSGSGKSTLCSLIAGLDKAQKGTVRIGGADIRSISREDMVRTVSFVFQDSRLIKGSIFDNVRLGRPEASREEVLEAMSDAQCTDIIKKMPDGIDTVLGTGGVYLSGGEQQRIAVARTMLSDTPLVILDEATAFADPDNENRIQKAFDKLAKDKTVIMIAHRLSTIVNADCIYVLEDGEIREKGTAVELMKKQGLFAKMWKEYEKSSEWKMKKTEKTEIAND